MPIKEKTLKQFIEKGGYDAVSKREDGTWKGIAEAARQTEMSEMQVRRILKEKPVAPSKAEKKYIAEFRADPALEKYKERFKTKETIATDLNTLERAWIIVKNERNQGNGKRFEDWDSEDWKVIWNHEDFVKEINPMKHILGIPEGFATPFHNMMKVTKKHDLLTTFKGSKYGVKKKDWYLTEAEIKAICDNMVDNETLIMFAMGLNIGGRFSSLAIEENEMGWGSPSRINFEDNTMACYESKMEKRGKAEVLRYLHPALGKLIDTYVKDYQIQPKKPLFQQSYSWYMAKLKSAANRAGIMKTVSTHIMKHTFVTQSSRHNVSAEIVEAQTGTDWATLSKHYKADNPIKAKLELQGIQPSEKMETFDVWFGKLVPVVESNYERIKRSGIVDGVRARLTSSGDKPEGATY